MAAAAPWTYQIRRDAVIAVGDGFHCHGFRSLLSGQTPRRLSPLPLGLSGKPFIKADGRRPAEVPRQLADVGRGETLVAGAGRLAPHHRAPAEDRLQFPEDVPDRRRFAAAYVIYLAHRRFQRGDGGGRAVIDVGVAARLQAVAENDDLFAVQAGRG